MLRPVLGVIVGYSLFAGSAVLLFQVSGVDPHGASGAAFRVFGLAYGAAFAVLAGYVTGAIAQRRHLGSAAIVAIIVALAGTASLVARPGAGAIWTQVASIVLFAPLVMVGGWARRARPPGGPKPMNDR